MLSTERGSASPWVDSLRDSDKQQSSQAALLLL